MDGAKWQKRQSIGQFTSQVHCEIIAYKNTTFSYIFVRLVRRTHLKPQYLSIYGRSGSTRTTVRLWQNFNTCLFRTLVKENIQNK